MTSFVDQKSHSQPERPTKNKNKNIRPRPFDLSEVSISFDKREIDDVRSQELLHPHRPQAESLDMAEIEAIETDIRHFLLPTEEANVVVECIVVHSPQLSDQETKPVFVEERIKRVLAVISHQGDAHQTYEQGW